MRVIRDGIYDELAEQVVMQVRDEGECEGVVEIEDDDCQIIMWWEIAMMEPWELKRWMVLSFDGGVRCGNDFSIRKFKEMYNLKWTDGKS